MRTSSKQQFIPYVIVVERDNVTLLLISPDERQDREMAGFQT